VTSNTYQLLDPQPAVLAAAHQHRANIVRLPGRFSVLPDAPRPTLITFDNLPLSRPIFIDSLASHAPSGGTDAQKEERDMEDAAAREAQLRRQCRKLGMILKKVRHRAVIGHPYHVLEPVKNLALSAARFPDGMTLDQAETFIAQQQ
jgi:hypothetical protein